MLHYKTGRQADGKREVDKYTDRQTNRQTNRQTDGQTLSQTDRQTRWTDRWADRQTDRKISASPTHGVVTSFHHLLVLVVSLQRGEQTERKRNTANSNCHCNPTGNGTFWSLRDRWVETPVQIIKEVIGQSVTTKRCKLYRLLVQTLFCSAPEA